MPDEAAPTPDPGAAPPAPPPPPPFPQPSLAPPLTTLECPRCGYDLTGQSDKRTDDNGTCAECGLTFLWSEVSNPLNATPQWLHEARGGFGRLLKTFARSLVPILLYNRRGLRIEAAINLPRLVTLAALAALLWLLLVTVIPRPFAIAEVLGGNAGELFWFLPPMGWEHNYAEMVLLGFFFALSIPLSFLALPDTMRIARVRRVHLLRAALYTTPAVALAAGLWFTFGWDEDSWLHPYNLDLWALGEFFEETFPLVILFTFVWLAWYWWIAIRRYLRLPAPFLVWFLMMIVSVLAAMAALVYLEDWLDW